MPDAAAMSISSLLAAALLSAALQTAPTEAETRYIGLFERFCLSTGGRAAEAMAAADAEGWVPAPGLIAPTPTAPIMDARVSHEAQPGGPQPLALLTSSSAPGDQQAHICAVDATNLEPLRTEVVIELLAAEIGLAPTRPASGVWRATWILSGDGPFVDEIPSLNGGADLFALARERPIYLIGVQVDGGQPFIVLSRAGR